MAASLKMLIAHIFQFHPRRRADSLAHSAGHAHTMVGVRAARVRQHPGSPLSLCQPSQFMDCIKPMAKSTAKKRTGRPPTGHDPNFTVRLPKQLVATIDKIAPKENPSRAEIMRQLMTEALEARKTKP